MKILVTGGAGFIGTNLTRYLLMQCNHQVVVYDKLTYAGNRGSLSDLENHPGFQFVQGDVCDGDLFASVLEQHRPNAIMHLAAESHVDRSIDGPEAFIQTNVVGTFKLLNAAKSYYQQLEGADKDRFRLLHVSTDEVFGSLAMDAPAFCESTAYDPHSPYSASKASSDHLVRAWQDTYGLPVLITNCSNNYGPFQFPEKLIPVVIMKCLRSESIPIYGKGENIRDWLYVEDHARALERVLDRGQVGETYAIGGDNELTNLELVQQICSLMDELRPRSADGKSPEDSRYSSLITFVTDRPGHDMRYAINASKIKQELQWAPLQNAESGFRQTVKWYLDNSIWLENILSGGYQLERIGGVNVQS
ncbi:dTDP-glucose 4,6-dehydratase [Planctomycetes bacterium K23_9]|uniref:dTDP-glucose 4,6-dehydratase n=1 Tax=Stieleria marina TaxID=1930275 RepID=A0A517NYS9_9BACT|nr:dTDP-glucose 4,6-dehydratase 2 [Planctomycetes bacterium K23_9]